MKIKSRDVPYDLKRQRILNWRIDLSEQDYRQYLFNEKGFEGEKKFDRMLDVLPDSSFFRLEDLLLEWNLSEFQLDTLLFSQSKIYHFEIKNNEGEHYIEDNKWYLMNGVEINNPVDQKNRSGILLGKKLRALGARYPIESKVVFVNPEFTLFQAPKNLPIILPTQLNAYIRELSRTTTKPSPAQIQLAKKIASLHKPKSSHSRVSNYKYEDMKKGIHCAFCHSFSMQLKNRFLACEDYGHTEPVENGVMRMVEEFTLLEPDRRITVSVIFEWTGEIVSKKTLWKILSDHYQLVKKSRSTYYIMPFQNL